MINLDNIPLKIFNTKNLYKIFHFSTNCDIIDETVKKIKSKN